MTAPQPHGALVRFLQSAAGVLLLLLPASERRRHRAAALRTLRDVLEATPRERRTREALAQCGDLLCWTMMARWRGLSAHLGRPGRLAGSVAADLAQASRSLGRRPGFTATMILVLGLGIGAGTAIFSVVDDLLLEPPAWDKEGTLVNLWRELPGAGMRFNNHEAEHLELYRTAASLEGVAAYGSGVVSIFEDGVPDHVDAGYLSPGLLPLLRTDPILGRGLREEDRDLPRVLLSEDFWRQRLDGDPDVVGTLLELDEEPHEVIGVLPASFDFGWGGRDLWLPLAGGTEEKGSAVARLAPGVTLEQARAEMEGMFEAPGEDSLLGETSLLLQSFERQRRETPLARGLLLLFGAVGLLVVTAGANAANLALTRARQRRGEFALRRALGASRWRLARQLCSESVVLGVLSGGLGLLLAVSCLPLLVRLAPEEIRSSVAEGAVLDPRALLFTLTLSAATGLLAAALPMLGVGRGSISGERTSAGSAGGRRVGAVFVAGQVAMSFALLLGAGLLLRSFDQVVNIDPGFVTEGVLALEVGLPAGRYADAGVREQYFAEVEERLESLPFVEGVSLASSVPTVIGIMAVQYLEVEGRGPLAIDRNTSILPVVQVRPDYFDVLGIPIVQGTVFDEVEHAGIDPVILGESLAELLFDGEEDVVGRRFRLGTESEWWTVVGVAAEVEQDGPASHLPETEMYRLGSTGETWGPRTFVVRGEGDVLARLPAIRDAVWETDPRVPLRDVRSLDDVWAETWSELRFLLEILVLLALGTCLLVLVGLYSVLSAAVAQRTREIGVRVALGARRGSVRWLVLRQSAVAVAVGVAAGFGLSRAGSGLIQSQLFDTGTGDGLAIVFAVLVTVAVVGAASWVPVSRATRVDPATSLRSE